VDEPQAARNAVSRSTIGAEPARARQAALDSFVDQWDELLAGEVGGEELLEMQRGLALEAVGRLGPSREFEVFLD